MQIFRGIRYGRADRFGQAELAPLTELTTSTARGPVSPQAPSRLEMVMGPAAPLVQDENCQVLSIYTPSRQGKRPVMVFLHGGAFVSGGGELPWYDGDRLAAEQDVVVVTVTYRLGALGYFHFAGEAGPSPGMSDQIVALQWVRKYVDEFGGDNSNLTVFGQSAGGMSIVGMMEWGAGGSLFDRAIIQSGAGGIKRSRAEAERLSAEFTTLLAEDPRRADCTRIVETQRKFAAERKQLVDWLPISPDRPELSYVDMMGGWTADDSLPFAYLRSGLKPSPDVDIPKLKQSTAELDAMFSGACTALAKSTAESGKRAWLYRFDWSSPDSGLGAPHCIELPFLLGSGESWKLAPMLGKAPWSSVHEVGKATRAMWASFARGDAPGGSWKFTDKNNQPLNIIP